MTDIRIEWLSASTDCDQAGCSGNYSEGARVYFDGVLTLDLPPEPSCYGSTFYDQEQVFGLILAKLGHSLVETSYE
jgi:hypothetical protein